MRTWEITFPIQDWLLDFFHIPHGLITHIEIHLSTYEINREENALFLEIAFLRQEDNIWPHRVEQVIFTITFSWPSTFCQEEESRAAHAPSQVSIVSDKTSDTADNREGSPSLVPRSLPPGYPSLSPHPPQLTPEQEEALPVPEPIFTRAPSNMLSVQQILQRIWSGMDLDQVTFNKGGITFWNLWDIDHFNNPQYYHDSSSAAGKNSLSRFPGETENEGEEEQIEGGDSQLPLQPIQEQSCASTPSRTTLDLGNTSNTSWPIPFINDASGKSSWTHKSTRYSSNSGTTAYPIDSSRGLGKKAQPRADTPSGSTHQ